MAYVKDTGTPGNNNAELPIGAVLDTTAKTLSLAVDTDLDSFVVLNNRQWLILETRNVNGTVNLIGECSYSEDPTKLADILTFANGVRDRMIALHTSFDITVTHHRLENVIDVYRGDEVTVVALAVDDTGVSFTFPMLWQIDDITPFAPDVITDTNIVIDSGCDNSAEWTFQDGDTSLVGGKLEFTDSGRAYPNTSEDLIGGVSYELSIDCDSLSDGSYRFFLGDTVMSSLTTKIGTKIEQLTCPENGVSVSVQGADGCIGIFDNFTCKRV